MLIVDLSKLPLINR